MIDLYQKILNCNEINQIQFDIERVSYQSSIIIREATLLNLLIGEYDDKFSNFTVPNKNNISVGIIQDYCEIIINLAKKHTSSDLINYQIFRKDVDNEINYLISNPICFNPVNEIVVLKYFILRLKQILKELSENKNITYSAISDMVANISNLPFFNDFENKIIERSLLKYDVEEFDISKESPISFKFSIVRNYAKNAPLPANSKIIDIHNCTKDILNFRKKLNAIYLSIDKLEKLNKKQKAISDKIKEQIELILQLIDNVNVGNISNKIHITNFLNNELRLLRDVSVEISGVPNKLTIYDLKKEKYFICFQTIINKLNSSICFN